MGAAFLIRAYRWIRHRFHPEVQHLERPPAGAVTLSGTGSFDVKAVGTSRYQRALSAISEWRYRRALEDPATNVGGFNHIVLWARLIHEDSNPHDHKAIRVDIDGLTVGYLDRERARYYRRKIRLAGFPCETSYCKARISGGWDRGAEDKGLFGVRLDLNRAVPFRVE